MADTSTARTTSRRAFLRHPFGGAVAADAPPTAPRRPPWAVAEAVFTDTCTRCGKCSEACPVKIIAADALGRPAVSFIQNGCDFCGACVEACPSGALSPAARQAGASGWTDVARITNACLSLARITCRVCGEQCDDGAIRFRFTVGGVSLPVVDAEVCTGCGMCVAPCPAAAISMGATQETHARQTQGG